MSTWEQLTTVVGRGGALVDRAGLTMLQIFKLKRAYPQSMNFRGLPWDWSVGFFENFSSGKMAATR